MKKGGGADGSSMTKSHVLTILACLDNSVSPAIIGQADSRDKESAKNCKSFHMHNLLVTICVC